MENENNGVRIIKNTKLKRNKGIVKLKLASYIE
jgi:hypothetical protein